VTGPKNRLAENEVMAFQGSNVLGLRFTLIPERAEELIARDDLSPDLTAQALSPAVDMEWPRAFGEGRVAEAHDDGVAVMLKEAVANARPVVDPPAAVDPP